MLDVNLTSTTYALNPGKRCQESGRFCDPSSRFAHPDGDTRTAALNWAAAELNLPTLADSGYEGAGHGIKTPIKQPADGKPLAVANRSVNRLLRGLRWQGERGFAILVGRWKNLRHSTISPSKISAVVAAALHLSHFEYRYLNESSDEATRNALTVVVRAFPR